MRKLFFAIVVFRALSAHASYDFCTVEVRKCAGDLQGGSAHCGDYGQIALINCSAGKLIKVTDGLNETTELLERKVDSKLAQMGLEFVTHLNKSKIYASKSLIAQGVKTNLCYAELKFTQIMSTFFTKAHLMLDGGYAINCVNPAIENSITVGELKSIQTPTRFTDGIWDSNNEYQYNNVTENLVKLMIRRGYKEAYSFPLDRTEWNKKLFEEDLMMFHGGDYRLTGFIFLPETH